MSAARLVSRAAASEAGHSEVQAAASKEPSGTCRSMRPTSDTSAAMRDVEPARTTKVIWAQGFNSQDAKDHKRRTDHGETCVLESVSDEGEVAVLSVDMRLQVTDGTGYAMASRGQPCLFQGFDVRVKMSHGQAAIRRDNWAHWRTFIRGQKRGSIRDRGRSGGTSWGEDLVPVGYRKAHRTIIATLIASAPRNRRLRIYRGSRDSTQDRDGYRYSI